MDDLISRQAVIELIASSDLILYIPEENQLMQDRIRCLSPAQPEPFTDTEQRIFLSAMDREENICRNVDTDRIVCLVPRNNLVTACHEITRKVKAVLWRKHE